MYTHLFNRHEPEAYLLLEEESEYDHTFGGEARHDGTIPPRCRQPVHLFYNLDLSDPRLGIQFPRSRITHLPLYYALGNLGGPFCYRVVSDRRIDLFCQPYPAKFRADIMKKYPEPLPRATIEFVPLGYDPKYPDYVWHMGGILGLAGLTARQKVTLKKKLEQWHLEEFGYPLIEKEDPDEPDPPLEEIIEECTPFTQGTPDDTCPNPGCETHKAGTPLPPLLVLAPEEDD